MSATGSKESLLPTPPPSDFGDSPATENQDTVENGASDDSALGRPSAPEASEITKIDKQLSMYDRTEALSKLRIELESASQVWSAADEQVKAWENDHENRFNCGPGGFGISVDHDLSTRREQAYEHLSGLSKQISILESEMAKEERELEEARRKSELDTQQHGDEQDATPATGEQASWSWTPWKWDAQTSETLSQVGSGFWSTVSRAKDSAISWAASKAAKATGLDQYGSAIKVGSAAAGVGIGLWALTHAFSTAGYGANQWMGAAETYAFLNSRGPWSARSDGGTLHGSTMPWVSDLSQMSHHFRYR